ncbi:hypothetical protein C8R44DRAFT_871990 [Mycena epipterygia]|nr:hypothetical protein C8R44DRAFT_871990 [Mycena epipterygia]
MTSTKTNSGMLRPQWPTDVSCMGDLIHYLRECDPVALGHSSYRKDFFPPISGSYASDETAYTEEDRTTVFKTMIIGRVLATPVFSGGHCTFLLDGGDNGNQTPAAFDHQLRALVTPVGEDDDIDCDNSANYRVLPWSDADRTTRSGGSYIELHLSHSGGSKATVYTPVEGTDELEVEVPARAKDFTFRVGDWVLAMATLHRRNPLASDDTRAYEILVRHLRVLPRESFDCALNPDDADSEDGTITQPSSPEHEAGPSSLVRQYGPPALVSTICPSDLDHSASTTPVQPAGHSPALFELPHLLHTPETYDEEREPHHVEFSAVPWTPVRDTRPRRSTRTRRSAPYALRHQGRSEESTLGDT